MTQPCRYAVYWVPQRSHPLWTAGCQWLGRDPEDTARSWPTRPSTGDPRRYGFHATLKAPMRLRDGVDEVAFVAAVRSLVASMQAFAMPPLEVRGLARFIALRPAVAVPDDHPLRVMADRCVVELDAFRAPFTEREWTKRSNDLDAGERERARRFGYHHVLDRWRFHMTLSDAFGDDARKAAMRDEARVHFAEALRTPLVAGEVAVFVETSPGSPFRLVDRLALSR